jgi:hypothetical protein
LALWLHLIVNERWYALCDLINHWVDNRALRKLHTLLGFPFSTEKGSTRKRFSLSSAS